MRTLLEFVIAATIIAIGWEKSLKERASELPWLGDREPQSHSRSSTVNPRPTATVSGAWMWDPNHQSILDTPRPKLSATVNSSLLDPNHKTVLDPASPRPVPSP